MEDPQGKWSLDKRVPIPSIVAGAVFILGQTIFLAMWMSNITYRVSNVEEFVKNNQPVGSQIAVIQEKITTVQTTINKIETFLQTLRGTHP